MEKQVPFDWRPTEENRYPGLRGSWYVSRKVCLYLNLSSDADG
jgi:hypothetical protein